MSGTESKVSRLSSKYLRPFDRVSTGSTYQLRAGFAVRGDNLCMHTTLENVRYAKRRMIRFLDYNRLIPRLSLPQ